MENFVSLIQDKSNSGDTIALNDPTDLSTLLPDVSAEIISDLVQANSTANYLDALDEQLLLMANNSGGRIEREIGVDEYFVAVLLSKDIDLTNEYSITLTAKFSDVSVSSTNVVSAGRKVIVFKLTEDELRELANQSCDVVVDNLTTGEQMIPPPETSFSVSSAISGGIADETSSGTVIDGFIENARVFRDANDNDQYDSGEAFVITGDLGAFTGLGGSAFHPIKVDYNGGLAVDVGSGDPDDPVTPFTGLLSAPAGSSVISPITTVIHEVMKANLLPWKKRIHVWQSYCL